MADDENEDDKSPISPEPPPLEQPASEQADAGMTDIPEDAPSEPQEELIMERKPAISSGPAKVLGFGFIMLVVVGFVLYSLLVSKPEPPQLNAPTPVAPPTNVVQTPAPPTPVPLPSPITGNASTPVGMPPPPPPPPPLPPTPPKLSTAIVPPPPPPPPKPSGLPPAPPDVKALAPIASGISQANQQRMKSNMLIMDAGPAQGAGQEQQSAQDYLNSRDRNQAFMSNVLKGSTADKVLATRLNNLALTIAQGKIINATLETAINTDLPGNLRAIVSRDIYPESGRNIVIPKGSRLIGTYNSGVLRGQRRVLIVWTRLIRPDGVDIMIGSPGIDSLGRSGIEGIADNKYSELFSTALLTSVLSIGLAAGTAAIIDDDGTTTTTNSNGTTTSGSAASTAAAAAVGNVGNIGKDVVNTMLDLRPTITVDQGTQVDVFVNRDLTFPDNAVGTQFIQ